MHPFGTESVLAWLHRHQFDIGLHGMGVIYRRTALDAFRLGILNAHIGFLPPFRGRSVVEWSLLFGAPLGVSVFFMDDGIDTGSRMVVWRAATTRPSDTLDDVKQRLFSADGENYCAALRRLASNDFAYQENDARLGQRYFVMSRILRGVAEWALSQRQHLAVAERFARLPAYEMTRHPSERCHNTGAR